MTPEKAEILALEALAWLAGRHEDITRFLAVSGMETTDLRRAAGEHDFLVSLLVAPLARSLPPVAVEVHEAVSEASVAQAVLFKRLGWISNLGGVFGGVFSKGRDAGVFRGKVIGADGDEIAEAAG